MKDDNKNHLHGTEGTTRWVHRHRRLAVWLMKIIIAGISAFLYYLKRQEREIEKEQKNDNR